jgi:Mg/Co/Ni transporter MgtE
MSKYDLLALPVVDETGVLLGMVTVDDALEVLEEEAAEDLALATGSEHERGRTFTLWSRIWRRSIWAVIWGIALIATSIWAIGVRQNVAEQGGPPWLAGALTFLPIAVILLPLLLRTGEEASSRAVAEIIEGDDEDERPTLRRRLATEGLLGLALGAATGLLALAFVSVWMGAAELSPVTVGFAIATGLATLLTVLFGSLLADWAWRVSDSGRTVSGTTLSIVAMAFAVAIYLALTLAVTPLVIALR